MNNLRTARNILFKAFLINLLVVLICWGYVMTGLTKYFMWAFPGLGTLESANAYILLLAGMADVLGLVLFLVPCLAITWTLLPKKTLSVAALIAKKTAKPAVKTKRKKRKKR